MKIIRTATVGMSLDIFCRGLLSELRAEGHDIIALSSPDDALQALGQREGVRTIGIEMARHISPLRDLLSLWQLWRILRRERPDMVHSMTPKAGLLSMIAARLAGVPLRVHTFTGLVWPTERGLKRLILQTTDRLTCLCASHVIPEGQGVMHDLQGTITHKPMRVLGYGNVRGVDMTYYQRQHAEHLDNPELPAPLNALPPLERPIFLFVGRILADKGVRELAEAFERLQRGTLLLVGPTEESLPLPENEHIIKVGMQADVRPWMERSDVLVLPSYREGFPNVVLEAGAMEMPCIVTDINGSREIILEGETGLIVPARSADHLLQAMQWMADHPEERKAMGRKARQHVGQHWELSYVRQCLKDYYRELESLTRADALHTHFLALLRIALGTQTELPRPLTPAEWMGVYNIARSQWLVGVMMEGIERLPEDMRPPEGLRLDWIGQALYIEQCNHLMTHVASTLPGLQLKGQAVAQFYPRPERRQCGDIDIWMPEGREAALRWAHEHLQECEMPNAFHISCPDYHGVPVEVHWTPTIMHNPWLNRRLQHYYRQLAEQPMGSGRSIAEQPVVYLLHHAFNHLLTEGLGLRQLVDLYWVLQHPECVPEDIAEQLRQLHLTRFMAAVGHILTQHLGLPAQRLPIAPNPSLGEKLLQEVIEDGDLGMGRDHPRGIRLLYRRLSTVVCHLRYAPAEVMFIPLISTLSGLKRAYNLQKTR